MPYPCHWSCDEFSGEITFTIRQRNHGVRMSEADARRFAGFVASINTRVGVELPCGFCGHDISCHDSEGCHKLDCSCAVFSYPLSRPEEVK